MVDGEPKSVGDIKSYLAGDLERCQTLDRTYDGLIGALFQQPRKIQKQELDEIRQLAGELYTLESKLLSSLSSVASPELPAEAELEAPRTEQEILELGKKWQALNTKYDREFLALFKTSAGAEINGARLSELRQKSRQLYRWEQTLLKFCSEK